MQNYHIKSIRSINKNSMVEFMIKLSYKSWDNVFGNDDNKDFILYLTHFYIPICRYSILVFTQKIK
jgi:hypothetical protein